MRFRILGKVLIISLSIAMIGWTTMIEFTASKGVVAKKPVEGTKVIITEKKTEAEKNIIINQSPVKKTDIQFYISDTGIKLPIVRLKYEGQMIHAPLKLLGYMPLATSSFREILGNPPARADPEPRGPL